MRGRRYTDAPGTTWGNWTHRSIATDDTMSTKHAVGSLLRTGTLSRGPSYPQPSSTMSNTPGADNVPINSADIVVNSPEVARQLADTASLPSPSPQSSHIRAIPTTSETKTSNNTRNFRPGRAKKRNQGVQVHESEVDDAEEVVGEESDEEPDENKQPHGVDSGPPPARKGRRARKKFFGLPKDRNVRGYDPLDYEQKYPPDPIYEEAQPNSRVWRMCLDEFQIFDSDLAEDARDTVDVLLVFAGLFPAVVTAFLIQAAEKLEPDYVQLSSSILYEILVVQRAFVNGSAVELDPVVSSPNALDFSPTHAQLWINGLWYTSLSLSLITALVAVLAKQWLHQYMAITSGTSLDRSLLRQFRYEGLQAWRVPLIIGLLPALMHLSLGIFFIGLIIFLAQLYPASAYVVGLFALIAYSAYFASLILSAAHPQCPYKTPLSNQLYVLLRPLLFPAVYAPDKSIREAETTMVVTRQDNDYFSVDVLEWVFANSTNPSARSIILQSFGGFPKHFHDPLHATFRRFPLGVETVSELNQLFRPLVSVLESPPNDPFDAQNAYARLERLVRADKFVINSDEGLLLLDILPTHPPVPLELVAAIASNPTRTHSPQMKLQAKEVFLNPEYLPTHLDLRLHPQTWFDLVDHVLNPVPPLPEDAILGGSPLLLPIIQLCANSPSLLDLYNTEEFQLYRRGLREFPVPFGESAVTFRRVCQVPAFREMVDQSLHRTFRAFDEFSDLAFDFYKFPGLKTKLSIVNYFHQEKGAQVIF
ncbi:hypothetical protein BDZ89DRAFT_1111241 [Hymenopellis radicata]|nr:hypothetical protein BDZ89DRAFT_1111241 [Hymenopellis radicata]